MIKLKNLLLEDAFDDIVKSLKLDSNDVSYIKSLNIPVKYQPWAAVQYAKDKDQFKEDSGRYEDAINLFEKNKSRIIADYAKYKSNNNFNIIKIFDDKSNEYLLKTDYRNIDNIKRLHDLESIVSYYKENISVNQKVKLAKQGAEKIYQDSNWLLLHIKTREASCYYGANTTWCTASTESKNFFDSYNSYGPLIIIIDKKNNRKYQLNYGEETGHKNSLKDSSDLDVSLELFEYLYVPLKFIYNKYFKRNLTNENISLEYAALYGKEISYNNKTKLYDILAEKFKISDDLVHNGQLVGKFGKCNGSIICSHTSLKTLVGMPMHVHGNFECYYNEELISLEGMPKYIDGTLEITFNNKLKNLMGIGNSTVVNLFLYGNELTSLKGAESVVIKNTLTIESDNIRSLVGLPDKIGKDFICKNNKLLESIEGHPKKINGVFVCNGNPKLNSIKTIPDASFYIVSSNLEKYIKKSLAPVGKLQAYILSDSVQNYVNSIKFVDEEYKFENMPPIDENTLRGVLFVLSTNRYSSTFSYDINTNTITILRDNIEESLKIFSLFKINNKINQKFKNMKYLFIDDIFYIYNHAGNGTTKTQAIYEIVESLKVYTQLSGYNEKSTSWLNTEYINNLPEDIKHAYISMKFPLVYGKDLDKQDRYNIQVSSKTIEILKKKVLFGYANLYSDYYKINDGVMNVLHDMSSTSYNILRVYVISNTPLIKIKKSQLNMFSPKDLQYIKKFKFELV